MTTKQLQATAYHEAGHAVVALAMKLKFKHVTVCAGDDSLGHVLYENKRLPSLENGSERDRARLYSYRKIVTSFAGALSEERFLGRRPKFGMEWDDETAYRLAFRVCSSPEATQSYLTYCWCTAKDLVATKWPSIEAVSLALLKKKKLSQDDVIQVAHRGAIDHQRQFSGRNA